jgi:hypothetical protein
LIQFLTPFYEKVTVRLTLSSRLFQPTAEAALAHMTSFMPFTEKQEKQEI